METIAIIGLGYVGFPLAMHFARHYPTIGYDTDPHKLLRLQSLELPARLQITDKIKELGHPDYIIIAVPTPVTPDKRPDLSALHAATENAASRLKPGATVVFESTVYPGATEDECIPILESRSGLRWRRDFNVAYSPERINPGDELHSLESVTKIVAGDTPETRAKVSSLYQKIVKADIYQAPSIRVAEAAKAIENAQRDLNIAFMNELAVIFNIIGIDTQDVIDAAATKWNFLPFRPGLVGGHCIGVDPYYLTHLAERVGYNPQVILAGRRINDGMGKYVAERTVKLMISKGHQIHGAKVNILGFTFKEDCDDARNTRVADIVAELESYGVNVFVHDPLADREAVRKEYGIELLDWDVLPRSVGLILAVPHKSLKNKTISELSAKLLPDGCIVDVKSVLDRNAVRNAGYGLWRL